MFTGYTMSAAAWIIYGTTTSLVVFLIVNVIEGFAIAFSYPAKQAFLVQVSPKRFVGTVTGLETTSMQLAGLIGTLAAPVMYGWMSGYVMAFGGVVNLIGLAIAAPVLARAWRRVRAAPATGAAPGATGSPPVAAAQPPSGIE
jgi:MFS family permease